MRILALMLGASVGSVCSLSSVNAGMVDLCGGAAGWRASWDNSLDPFVQIIASDCTQVGSGRLFIEKSAQFLQGPTNGVFPSIDVQFTQTSPTAVTRIVIDDESIRNSTGVAWTDFHMELLGGGNTAFDPVATATSGGPPPIGFSVAPFTLAAFNPGNTRLDISGGVVLNNSQWFPGDASLDGQLHIVAATQTTEPFSAFTLRETPTPEPASAALLGLALLAISRRRR